MQGMFLVGASQMAVQVKDPSANAGDSRDMDLIPGLGRSPGAGNGNLLQYSCLGNPMDRGAVVNIFALTPINGSFSNKKLPVYLL